MEYNEIKKIIQENSGSRFIVRYKHGVKKNQRLFVSSENLICEFLPYSRKKGMIIPYSNIESIKPINNNIGNVSYCRTNLRLVVKYLTASGLWNPMLNGAKKLQSLSDDVLLSMRDWDTYHKVAKEIFNDFDCKWFGMDCFYNLFIKKIHTTNFMPYEKEYRRKSLKESIRTKENARMRWRYEYDNSYEVRFDEDYAKGWYSEEYKNCSNGHYYYLLDETHALFGEDD